MTTVRRTNHWRGVVAVALLAGATGLLFKRPFVLLTACVGAGYAIYPHVRPEPPVDVGVDRRLSETDPSPGDEVTVEVTVENESDRPLPDLRLVDGVPPMLTVADGSARHAAALRAGESTTFSYTLTAAHGTHQFRPTTVIARDVSGATEVETAVEPSTDELRALTALPDAPIEQDSSPFPGNVLTDESGEGVEFSRVREYRRGDDRSRIDWNRFARTGDLSTVEFRREQSVTVVACVDARAPAYCGAESGPHAVSHGVAAAQELLEAVWDRNEKAGLAALGRELCWLAPGQGTDHEERVRHRLLSHPTLSPRPPSDAESDSVHEAQLRELRTRLGPATQLLLITPLPDGFIVDAALELAADGRELTVVSPDVTAPETPGERLAAVERRNRIHRLRRGGIRVVDWDTEATLAEALIRARTRWSQ